MKMIRTGVGWRTRSGWLACDDAPSTPGSTQPGPARGTPDRCLFRHALTFPALRRQVHPVYLLPAGSAASSDA